MTSALVHVTGLTSAHPLAPDLESAGIQVLGVLDDFSALVHEVVRLAPDVVIFDDPLPGEVLFRVTQAIFDTAPRPVVVFTADVNVDNIVRAAAAGVHAYVVNGYAPHRLRPVIHVAQARFQRERALRQELLDVSSRFEERKMVDRAKGILMRARQVSDDDAFQMLRTASMHSNQRLGQVSQYIIHSARFAEAVNRSGQLRMLSQRLVKLHLLQLAGVLAGPSGDQLKASVMRVDANLALLGKNLSKSTFGDLLGQVMLTWTRLKHALQDQPRANQMAETDGLAEQLLQEAERLTDNLENAGSVVPLHVLNLAGRQRMLSQRFAKYVLLGVLAEPGAASAASTRQRGQTGMAESREAFEEALRFLNASPLTNSDIRGALDAADIFWRQMLASAEEVQQSTLRDRQVPLERLAMASESLLDVFEQLATHYERSMQMLVGS